MSKALKLGLALAIIGVLAVFVWWRLESNTYEASPAKDDYPLLSQRIFADNPNQVILNFSTLRQDLRNYFEEKDLQGTLYFEYLPTGTSVRAGSENQEIIASLIKVPAAMELYKAYELGFLDINKTIAIKEEWIDKSFGDLHEKGAGYELTIREAAEIMLKDSDNTALYAVVSQTEGLLPPTDSIFNALDMDFSLDSEQILRMNARSYSSILKCLYFSCYLSYEHSQAVLQMLTETTFTTRLPAGIDDKSLKIAHKYGTYKNTVQGDCGIIYLPGKHYLLCMMIEGVNNGTTNNYFREVSEKVYRFVKQS